MGKRKKGQSYLVTSDSVNYKKISETLQKKYGIDMSYAHVRNNFLEAMKNLINKIFVELKLPNDEEQINKISTNSDMYIGVSSILEELYTNKEINYKELETKNEKI